ncbi:MAG: hypothetical protein QXW39_06215 [Candidatus Bathyarchaeia archaeon]
MVAIDQSRKICIMADSGWGKTTLTKNIISELSRAYKVFIYNTDFEVFPQSQNVIPLKPDINKVGDIDYLSLVITRLRANFSNFVLVITDLDKFFDKTTPTTIKSEGLKDLYGTGRHQRILTIIESKQPRYIPSKILANSNLFYIGKFTELEDAKRLRNYVSEEEIASLQKYEFIEYDKWNGEKRKVKIINGEITYI